MSMSLVFTQILVILLYVLVGFGAGKLKLITPEQRRYLSGLCSTLILPFTKLRALVFAAMCAAMALSITLIPGVYYLVPLTGQQWLTQLGLACAAAVIILVARRIVVMREG